MFKKVQNIKGIILCGILLFMSAFASLASGENRNVAVDQTIGGMEQGRRIQSPGNYNNKGITSGQPGSATTPAHDIHTISQESEKATTGSAAKNITDGGNHGFLYVNGQASNTQNGTNQAGREQNSLPIGQANANTSQSSTGQENGSANGSVQAGTEQPNGSVNVNADETSTGQTSDSAEVNTPQAGTEQIDGSTNVGTPVQQAGQTTTEQVNNPVDTSAGTNVGTGETKCKSRIGCGGRWCSD
ncbi:MAG: hypothetical protein HZC18_03985 [Candidatus Omnitrophica bacterium]|nr:hypothetical protein [Candidatus Omnitrophota bacterium]